MELGAWRSHRIRFEHEQRVDLELRGIEPIFTFEEHAGLTEIVMAAPQAA